MTTFEAETTKQLDRSSKTPMATPIFRDGSSRDSSRHAGYRVVIRAGQWLGDSSLTDSAKVWLCVVAENFVLGGKPRATRAKYPTIRRPSHVSASEAGRAHQVYSEAIGSGHFTWCLERDELMSEIPSVGAFAIIPSNDLTSAIQFWERLGFARTGGKVDYIIFTGWGCEVHLIQAGTGLWRVPENNPFGIFIRTPDVAAIASRVEDMIIRPGGVLRHREWGLYEVGISGPDGLLVRIGWPSNLIKGD